MISLSLSFLSSRALSVILIPIFWRFKLGEEFIYFYHRERSTGREGWGCKPWRDRVQHRKTGPAVVYNFSFLKIYQIKVPVTPSSSQFVSKVWTKNRLIKYASYETNSQSKPHGLIYIIFHTQNRRKEVTCSKWKESNPFPYDLHLSYRMYGLYATVWRDCQLCDRFKLTCKCVVVFTIWVKDFLIKLKICMRNLDAYVSSFNLYPRMTHLQLSTNWIRFVLYSTK